MVRSTFAGFTTAQLALSASQRALDVTGQNISNINTAGYTRQRLDLASISPTGHSYFQMQTDCRVGQGVQMTGIIQIRDPFLDICLLYTSIFGGKKLSDVVEASVADGKVSFKSKDTAGNSIEITGGSGDVLQHLGFLKEGESIADLGKDALVMSNGQTITAGNVNQAMKSEKISDFLAGKSLSFSYNGVNKTIEIGSGLNSKADLVNDLQSKLDDAFGKGRIRVDTTDVGDQFKLNFKTVTPKGEEDKSSSLILTGGDENLMGKNFGLLKVDENVSNRVNLSASLKDSGLAGAEKLDLTNSKILIINGVSVEITKDMTVEDIMKKFNEDKNADFVISYQKDSDRFMVTSKEKGASGTIEIGGDKEVAEMFFGTGALDKVAKGQDAVLQVKYAGDDMPTEIVRNSNSFTMDGLTVSLKGTFGYDEKGNLDPTAEAITFDANVDTETASKTVKEMVTAFNEILELINKEAKTCLLYTSRCV